MENGSKVSAPAFLWPTILTIAAALYGYTKFMPSLESARPQGKPLASENLKANETPSYPARLWEDPMGEPYREELKKARKRDLEKTTQQSKGFYGMYSMPWLFPFFTEETTAEKTGKRDFHFGELREKPLLLPVMVPGPGTNDDKEYRMKTRYAVISGLTTAGYRPSKPSSTKKIECFDFPLHVEERSSKTLLIPFEQFQPDNCRRADDRTAKYTDVVVCWIDEDQIEEMPVEELERLRDHFSVIWNEALMKETKNGKGMTLAIAAKILANYLSKEKNPDTNQKIPTRVIGPSNSDMLMKMIEEYAASSDGIQNSINNSKQAVEKIQLYSTRSTIEPLALTIDDTVKVGSSDNSEKESRSRVTLEQINWFLGRSDIADQKKTSLAPPPFEYFPVIGTDWHLAQAIRDELTLRDAWPGESKKNECIVLVTEKDTNYGRSAPFLFKSLLPDPETGTVPLKVYKYVRGIDGSLSTTESEKMKAKGDETDQRRAERLAGYYSTGDYQVDYLRRLGDEMERWDQQLKKRGGRGILAVGVVGTDIYDKLLLLRALRNRFPNACFFTNDLDDNYCRPSELDYTQNLLVASHFGLALHPQFQRDVAPFRDNYQTATFLATLEAVEETSVKNALWRKEFKHDAKSQLFWPDPSSPLADGSSEARDILRVPAVDSRSKTPYLRPLVFEISRNGPYLLTPTGNDLFSSTSTSDMSTSAPFDLNAAVHAPGLRELNRLDYRSLFYLILGTVFFVLVLGANITWIRDALGWILIPFVRLASIAGSVCSQEKKTETPDVSTSESSAAAIPAAAANDAPPTSPNDPSLGSSEKNPPTANNSPSTGKSRREHLGIWVVLIFICIVVLTPFSWLKIIWENHLQPDGEPFTLFAGISIWPSILLRIAAAALSILFMFLGWSKIKENLTSLWSESKLPGRENPVRRRKSLFPIGVWNWEDDSDSPVEKAFGSYLYYGSWRFRLVRGCLWTAFYGLFSYALMQGTDSIPIDSVRGSLTRFLASFTLYASTILMFLVCFLMIDAMQLCQRFVRILGRNYHAWKKTTNGELQSESFDKAKNELRTIRTIAEHTDVINKLIWYPFIVLLLLVMARQRVFFGTTYPMALVVLHLILLAALFFHTWRLRTEADDSRKAVISRLREIIRESSRSKTDVSVDYLKSVVEEIDQEDLGAFSHWTQDYFLKAMTLPLLGEGGFALFNQLLGN